MASGRPAGEERLALRVFIAQRGLHLPPESSTAGVPVDRFLYQVYLGVRLIETRWLPSGVALMTATDPLGDNPVILAGVGSINDCQRMMLAVNQILNGLAKRVLRGGPAHERYGFTCKEFITAGRDHA